MNLRNLRVGQRFLILTGIAVAGFVVLLVIGGLILDRVMIGGDLYHRVVQKKDVVADLLPPPHYLAEPYLLCHQIVYATWSRNDLLAKLDHELGDFEASRDRWQTELPDGELKKRLLIVATAGDEFVKIVRQEFLPAVRDGKDASDLRGLLTERLANVFERHHKAVEDALIEAKREIVAAEGEAESDVAAGEMTTVGVAALVVLLMLVLGFLLIRPVMNRLRRIHGRMRELAESEGDLAARIEINSQDEMGELARSFNAFVGKIAGLVQAVRKSSIQLTSTSTEMAATSREQEANVNAFGSSTTQIAASVQQISATGAELLTTIDEVTGIANRSAGLAGTGRTSLQTMEATMSQLTESSASISGKLAVINDKAGDINSVVTTITKVADQTNLLSVNAAIEAEKAGEYGRGFLVVAQEIRRLADQTAAATLDIEQTVGEMQTAVSAGVMEMDKFGDHVRRSVGVVGEVATKLGEIIGEVERLTRRFESVGQGMKSQSQGADQINDAMGSLNETVQQTVTSLREVTAVAEELRGAANTLNEEIAKFRLED